MKTTRPAALVAAVLLAVVACAAPPTMTLADAQAVAQKDVKDAAAAVFPAGYTLTDQAPQHLNCTDSAGKTDGRFLMGVSFRVDGADGARNNAYFDALKSWWTGHGWSSSTDNRPSDMFMNAGHDGYLMSLQFTRGRLTIGASTPCV